MTITEFLEARITEDIDTAEHVIRHLEQLPHKPGAISVGGRDVYDLRRVTRECEAKRRIVNHESYDRAKIGAPPYNGPINDLDGGRHPELIAYIEEHGERVTDTALLRILAAVYADHPDYDQTWRP